MDAYFHGYMVKYTLLDKFIYPIARTNHIKSINIFINLDDVLHSFHNPLVNAQFQIAGRDAGIQLVSNIINLIAHYRYWAIKHGLFVKIFATFTSTLRSFKNNIYIPKYRQHFKDTNSIEYTSCYFVNNAIQEATPILPIIAKYTPGIYIIDSKYLEPSMVPLYIADELIHADWNILVSRDTYDLQYSYRQKWSMLSPKKDFMSIIDREGIWNYIAQRENIYKDGELEARNLLYPFDLFILAKAAVGDRFRSIPRLRKIGWKTLFKYLDKIMDENKDASTTTLKIKLIDRIRGKKISNETLNCNLSSINIDIQKDSMLEIDKTLIYSQIIDIPDYDNLQELNRTRFMKFPLNLKFLCNTPYSITPFDRTI